MSLSRRIETKHLADFFRQRHLDLQNNYHHACNFLSHAFSVTVKFGIVHSVDTFTVQQLFKQNKETSMQKLVLLVLTLCLLLVAAAEKEWTGK